MRQFSLRLSPIAPFRLDLTAWALRRRPDNAIDLWDGQNYGRVLAVGNLPVRVWVRQTKPPNAPEVEIRAVSPVQLSSRVKAEVADIIERTLGLRTDLSGFYEMVRDDPDIGVLVRRYMGLKPPRVPTVFEALINAIACQQLTVLVGITLLNRLARKWGTRFGKSEDAFGFPLPHELRQARPESIRALGFSGQKTKALLGLVRRYCSGVDDLESLAELGDDEAIAKLLELRGIGRWSAEYAMLRGLGRLNVFPVDDVAGQKNVRRWLGLRRNPSSERVRRLLARWYPYQGLLYFHFLLANLESHGILA
jgi:DNA-3-methyladenine glycosylase II